MVQALHITPINSATNLSILYDTYIIDASSSSFTLTLPLITCNGYNFLLRRIDNSTNLVTLIGTGGQLINGLSSILIQPDNDTSVYSLNDAWITVISPGGFDTQISLHGIGDGYSFIINTSATNFDAFYTRIIYRGINFYGTSPVIMTICCSLNTNSATPQNFVVRIQNLTVNAPTIVATISGTASVGPDNYFIGSTTTFNNVPTTLAIWDVQAKLGTVNTAPSNPNLLVRFHWIYIKFS